MLRQRPNRAGAWRPVQVCGSGRPTVPGSLDGLLIYHEVKPRYTAPTLLQTPGCSARSLKKPECREAASLAPLIPGLKEAAKEVT